MGRHAVERPARRLEVGGRVGPRPRSIKGRLPQERASDPTAAWWNGLARQGLPCAFWREDDWRRYFRHETTHVRPRLDYEHGGRRRHAGNLPAGRRSRC
eukprot:scaffold582_cov385-Prasinococcus_capsulatus_cf.AAC.38